ncbi:MAG TPA: hypothetical protein VEC09_02070 [Actinomycetota bacterium]|nr:hypothetical protein [Actinomycetota bacterium]
MVVGIDGAPAIAGSASLRRIVDTSAWHHPSPEPTGISRVGSTDRFVVVDGEVDETALWQASNVWSVRPTLHPLGSWSSDRYTFEPTDVVMPSRRLVYLSDDDSDRIIAIEAGPDRAFGTQDDLATGHYTRSFSLDPEGIAVGAGKLFIANGDFQRVVRLLRGTDGVFGTEDDVVRGFSTKPLGLSDPEGIAFFEGNLFIVSRADGVIVQTKRSGAFVDSYDISSSGIVRPSGIAVTAEDGALTAWVTDRGSRNDGRIANDGRIYVFSLSGRIPDQRSEPPVAPRVGRLFDVIVARLFAVSRWSDLL